MRSAALQSLPAQLCAEVLGTQWAPGSLEALTRCGNCSPATTVAAREGTAAAPSEKVPARNDIEGMRQLATSTRQLLVSFALADVYRGELLQGVYYDWAEPLRNHFRTEVANTLVELSQACEDDGDLDEAIKALSRAITLEPYAEHAYRRLMLVYGELGRVADVERVYRELEATLSEGLDVEPSDETSAVRDVLLRRRPQHPHP
jgi:DNA-binding SARP family transcriptional activator